MRPIGPWDFRLFGLPELRCDLSDDEPRLVLRDTGNIGERDQITVRHEPFHTDRLQKAVAAFNDVLWREFNKGLPKP